VRPPPAGHFVILICLLTVRLLPAASVVTMLTPAVERRPRAKPCLTAVIAALVLVVWLGSPPTYRFRVSGGE